MSFESIYKQHAKAQDHSEVMADFGFTKEQAIEYQWRIARTGWWCFQLGVYVTLGVILMTLGGWALWRFLSR